MSILTNWYKNKKYMRPIILGIVVTALGATGGAYLAPILVPLLHVALCGDQPDCGDFLPKPVEIPLPKKEVPPASEPLCVVVDGIKVCN